MDETHDSLLVTDFLVRNEESIGELYLVYADKYQELSEFWHGLALEEKRHADCIRKLADKVKERGMHIEPGRFRTEAIGNFTKYVQSETERARKEQIPLITALSIALDIEKSIIESNFFEIFDTDSAELRHVLHELAASTSEHVKRVEECWAEHRQAQDT